MKSSVIKQYAGIWLLPALVLSLLLPLRAQAQVYHETLGPAINPGDGTPFVLATGSGVASGGVGLFDDGEGTISVNVPAGATVEQVLLYWEARDNDGDVDDELLVNGMPAQGTLVGTSGVNTIASTFRADITALGVVAAGANSIDISGFDDAVDNRDGASIVVIFDDGSGLDEISFRDGADFAWLETPIPPGNQDGRETVEQTFTFAAADFDRTVPLTLMVGDTNPDRPDQLIIKVDGAEVFNECNFFVGLSGPQWSNRVVDVNVPMGATSLSVQIFSGCNGMGPNPESLVWIFAGISVDTPPDEGDGCTFTIGGYKNIKKHLDRWQIDPNTAFPFNPSQSYIQVLNTPPAGGDAWYILAHQYIAAYLNVLNGADESAIAGLLSQAETLLSSFAPGSVPKSEKDAFTSLADTLDDYNNGDIGPGHCEDSDDEEETASSSKAKASLRAFPNPFNPQTTISFELNEASYVRVAVYDLVGREVAVLVDGELSAGSHAARFDASGLASGTYLYRLTMPTGSVTKTFVLLK